MALAKWLTMTPKERRDEKGSEPPCPFCKRPRATRSDYIRCNPCGVNWSKGDDINRDPRMTGIKPIQPETSNGALPANSTSRFDR